MVSLNNNICYTNNGKLKNIKFNGGEVYHVYNSFTNKSSASRY
jgi:hypothetical protein